LLGLSLGLLNGLLMNTLSGNSSISDQDFMTGSPNF
jgi:hypothetical protein